MKSRQIKKENINQAFINTSQFLLMIQRPDVDIYNSCNLEKKKGQKKQIVEND